MSRHCDLTGVGPRAGNSISHSKHAVRRRWLPNLKRKRIYIPEENRWISVRATANALKTLSKKGMGSIRKMAARSARQS